jgi:Flp pilus assembly protein TadG
MNSGENMRVTNKKNRGRKERGNSIIEFAFFMPWLVFLFVGALDWGFFAYSLIASQAAARVAALYTSTSSATATDTTTVCTYALEQLRRMPNVASLSSCGSGTTVSPSAPVAITATSITGTDGLPAAQVSITYMTPALIPVMGSIPRQLTITRTIQMRIRG